MALLQEHGLNEGDYTLINAGDDAPRIAAMLAGEASATLLDEAVALQYASQLNVLARPNDMPQLPASGMAVAQGSLTDPARMAVLRDAAQAILEGLQASRSNRDQMVPVLEQELSLSAQDAGQIFDDLSGVWTTDGRPTPQAMQLELQSDQAALSLPNPIDPTQVYDFSLLDSLNGNGSS